MGLGKWAALAVAAGMLASCASTRAADGFTPRLTTPRLAPVSKEGLSEAQRQMLASRADFNIYKTLAHHPDLYGRWSPMGQILLNNSSIPARHREMLMLRMGWLCQSEYEWSQHARIAAGAGVGMSEAEIHRIAEGPKAAGWTDFERALLTAVDELRYEAVISDATWRALKSQYSDQQAMEALFTAAQYQLVSMALNSLGVQLDPELTHRLPTDLPAPALAARPTSPRLTQPRIAPLAPAQWSAEQRALITPELRPDGSAPNLYGTMIHHPRLYGARRTFGRYLQRESLLPARTRELLIMRTAWLIRAPYEWGHHVEASKAAGLTEAEIARIAQGPEAAGWSAQDRAVLRAADELRREAFVSDATWKALSAFNDTKQMVEIVYTVGGYTMTGLALNSFGVQLEPGYPRLPGEG